YPTKRLKDEKTEVGPLIYAPLLHAEKASGCDPEAFLHLIRTHFQGLLSPDPNILSSIRASKITMSTALNTIS
ncbi:hypothetical protein, partial [Muriicola sp.]|uniref:hypothetical protein n=1 Tax=Muriicola sp. TaxID=2020856 RepID=UPI003562C3BB